LNIVIAICKKGQGTRDVGIYIGLIYEYMFMCLYDKGGDGDRDEGRNGVSK